MKMALLSLSVVFVLGIGCTGGKNTSANPKDTVIEMFGAMEKDDPATLVHTLDMNELMRNTDQDYSLSTDEPRVFRNPQELLNDMTGDGLTKQRWFSHQRIIGNTEIMGDAASVEVTFIDKATSRGYRTKFGLHKVSNKWKIYSFKTIGEAQS